MNNVVRKVSIASGPKVRIKAFDFLKLYAIFLVLWGHSIQYFLSTNHYDEPVYRIIYSFHMPLFMMISGYFAQSSMSYSPLDFVRKKFVQLILPTFIWGVILGFICLLIRNHLSTQSPTLWIIDIKETIVFILKGFVGPYPFWFLKTCFFCYILAYCGSHLRLSKYLWMALTIIISQYIPHFVLLDTMYPCFVVGMELRDNKKFCSMICNRYLWLSALFLIMLCFWDQFFWGYDGILKTIMIDYLEISNNSFLDLFVKLYRLAIGIVGSLAFIGIACSLIPQGKTNKFISLCCNWGQYTLGVYILQNIILETLMAEYILLDGVNFYIFNFLVAPLLSLIVLIICVHFIKLTSKSPKLALFFWGKISR